MSNKEIKFNLNDTVKVKLTEHGIAIMKHQHKALQDAYPAYKAEFNSPVDEDGYARFQFHSFIQTFGAYTYLGCEMPFDTEAILIKP